MKASEALTILEALDPSVEVTLTISKWVKKETPPTTLPTTLPTPTFWDPYNKEYVIGKQFWPKQDTNPYPNYIYCTNTGTMQ